MKKVVSLLLTLLMVTAIIPVTNVLAVSKLDNVVVTELVMRYDDNLAEEYYKNGNGEVTSAYIWKNYLLMTVNYFGTCNGMDIADQGQLVVYSLKRGTPEFLGKWNKTDLGIPTRGGGNSYRYEDFLMEVYADNENIYVETSIEYPGKGNRAAIHIYQNCLEAEGFPAPTKLNVGAKDSSLNCTLIGNADIEGKRDARALRDGYRMTVIGGTADKPKTAVTIFGKHSVTEGKGHISAIDITEDAEKANNTNINEYNLLQYTDKNGKKTYIEKIYDTVFDGNKAYILALTTKEGTEQITNKWSSYISNTMAIFTVNFDNPHNPVLEDVAEFNGDFPYDITKDINGSNPSGDNDGYNRGFQAGLTVEDGYAYVSTSFIAPDYFKNKNPHIKIFKQENDTFISNGEIELTGSVRGSGTGFAQIQVIDNILVGVPSDGYGNPAVYMTLNEDRTGYTEYKKIESATGGTGVYSLRSVKLGTKAIFPCLSSRTASDDTNRATVYVFDIIAAGGEWEAADNKASNSVCEGMYASFDESYLKNGINTLRITGSNLSNENMSICVIFALYDENGKVEKTQVGTQNTIAPNGEIDIIESIDLEGITDLTGKFLRAYIWEDMTTAIPVAKVVAPQETAFNFAIDKSSMTSAGVYDESGKLIRTLWSAVLYDTGEYTGVWDGLDDFGNAVYDGNYTVKVLSNNVEYEKLVPVIGNTSDCLTWDSFISSYNSIFDMSFDKVNNKINYCSDHVEGGYGLRYLNADNITANGGLLNGSWNMTATHTATDGKLVYWGAAEPTVYRKDRTDETGQVSGGLVKAFIYATNDAGIYTFSDTSATTKVKNKWAVKDVFDYPSALNYTVTDGEYYNRIGGLEVQQDGKYLISAFRDAGKVYVNNKITGEAIWEMSISEPSAAAMSRGGGNLDNIIYIAYKTSEKSVFAIAKYKINANGSLTKVADVATGLDVILAMAVSPDGKSLAVAQGGAVDKVFIYSTEDSTLKATYGTGESYYTDPTVKDDKLMFDDLVFDYSEPYEHSFLEFADNDSVFVGDSGNTRILLLDLSGDMPIIEDMIAFQSNSYNASVVYNDEARIFSEKKEYSIDYTKMEEYYENRTSRLDYDGFGDVWKLEKNYMLYIEEKFPEITTGISSMFFRPFKATNGYTYFGMATTNGDYMYKMSPEGIIAATGINVNDKDIHPDGSIWYRNKALGTAKYYQMKLSGFDENANPIYGEPVLEAEIDMNKDGSIPYNSDAFIAVTESGKLIVLESPGPSIEDYKEIHMNLGAIDISKGTSTEFLWTAAPATLTRNESDFPRDGFFDIGNSPNYTTKYAFAYGENVIFHYRGEGYKGRQANSFLHFNDDGLLIGVFGKNLTGRGDEYDETGAIIEALPCNSMSTSIAGVPGDPDTAYIYQNTEGAAGGVHITRVTGLTSLKERNIPIILKNGMVRGVMYTCYNSGNLDAMTVSKKGTANNFNIPFITNEEGLNRSVRFEGYYKPEYTDNHRFSVMTDGKVKMIIDGIKVIDGIGDASVVSCMEENRMYKFTIEVSALPDGTLSYFDMGHMENNIYEYMDSEDMICFCPSAGMENKVNLLDGFTFAEDFENGMYGWEIGSTGTQYEGNAVTVLLNKWNYRYNQTPDIYMNMTAWINTDKTKSDIYVSRRLGTVYGNKWKIDMDVRYTGMLSRVSNTHTRNSDGSAIEIVDKNGKIIADLVMYHNENNSDILVQGNGRTLMADSKLVDAGQSYYNYFSVSTNRQQFIVTPHNFTVEPTDGGKVKITYAGNEVVASVRESGADITSPAQIRFVNYNNRSLYRSNQWNVTRLDFTYDTTK